MPIAAGIPAPEIKLLDDTNSPRKLSDYRGRNIVLYFYSADDTHGCTNVRPSEHSTKLLGDLGLAQ
jgi:peroxiredoxin Q/BCP